METDPRDLLRGVERAEAAPWVDYPPTPRWYPPAVGLWSAALLGLAAYDSTGLTGELVRLGGLVAMLALLGVFQVWYRRYRGTMPTGRPPLELRRPARVFAVTGLAVAALGLLLAYTAPVWVGPLVAFALMTPLVAWYERAYARAARATRERLA